MERIVEHLAGFFRLLLVAPFIILLFLVFAIVVLDVLSV